ncbi:hypothetical protein [Pseudochelatococcus sp. G4_1912]
MGGAVSARQVRQRMPDALNRFIWKQVMLMLGYVAPIAIAELRA